MYRPCLALMACAIACTGPAVAAIAGPIRVDKLMAEPAALAGITAAHNAVRARVGLKIPLLSWNAQLAASAQAWANQCIDATSPGGLIDHNPKRSVGMPWYVGENIYASSGTATAKGAVLSWASEQKNYDYAHNTCNGTCGHYTQMVWAKSVFLGCGIAFCPKLRFSSSIVCDYAPGGNNGGRPY
jgi:pathogenesis-related protein 1